MKAWLFVLAVAWLVGVVAMGIVALLAFLFVGVRAADRVVQWFCK